MLLSVLLSNSQFSAPILRPFEEDTRALPWLLKASPAILLVRLFIATYSSLSDNLGNSISLPFSFKHFLIGAF